MLRWDKRIHVTNKTKEVLVLIVLRFQERHRNVDSSGGVGGKGILWTVCRACKSGGEGVEYAKRIVKEHDRRQITLQTQDEMCKSLSHNLVVTEGCTERLCRNISRFHVPHNL
jgi:hypothetical protein